jgi:hypothetical protein
MNPTNDNTGSYPATEVRAFLDGVNGDGTGGKTGVTTAAFLNALKVQIGDYILPVRRLLSNKGDWAWVTCSLWLLSENEVFGANAWGEIGSRMGREPSGAFWGWPGKPFPYRRIAAVEKWMRRKLTKFTALIDTGKMSFADLRTAYQSWRGSYIQRFNAHYRIVYMDKLYNELFINIHNL